MFQQAIPRWFSWLIPLYAILIIGIIGCGVTTMITSGLAHGQWKLLMEEPLNKMLQNILESPK